MPPKFIETEKRRELKILTALCDISDPAARECVLIHLHPKYQGRIIDRVLSLIFQTDKCFHIDEDSALWSALKQLLEPHKKEIKKQRRSKKLLKAGRQKGSGAFGIVAAALIPLIWEHLIKKAR